MSFYKIGYQLAFAGGLDFARVLTSAGKQVFVDSFMKGGSLFLLLGKLGNGEMLLNECLPVGEFFIPSIQRCIHWIADGTTDIVAGDQIVRKWMLTSTVIVVIIHIVKQAADMLTQRIVNCQH